MDLTSLANVTTTTQKMNSELSCTECHLSFSSAATLLKHFAQHASQVPSQPIESGSENTSGMKKTTIPDLYPIASFKSAFKQSKSSTEDSEENNDSGVEDLINPLRYCTVSMETTPSSNMNINECKDDDKCKTVRKYECTYCYKLFGWSTDLKRHILTHTGERPFKCDFCDWTFTRKFLLLNHREKEHNLFGYAVRSPGKKVKVPPLKPIGYILKRKSRKQDKQKIQRKVLDAKNLYQSLNDCFEVPDKLVFST